MPNTRTLSLADIPNGGRVTVVSFEDIPLSLKLMEMGFLPGTELRVDYEAPLGCPVCVTLEGDYHLTLRKSEAQTIQVNLI